MTKAARLLVVLLLGVVLVITPLNARIGIAVVGVFVAGLLALWAARPAEISGRWLIAVVAVINGYYLVNSFFVSTVQYRSVGQWPYWLISGIVFFMALSWSRGVRSKVLSTAVITATLVAAGSAVGEFIVTRARSGGLATNPNMLGGLILFGLFAIWPHIWRRDIKAVWPLSIAAIFALTLVASFSVTGAAAAGGTLVIWGITRICSGRVNITSRRLLIGLAVVVLLGGAAWVAQKRWHLMNAPAAVFSWNQRLKFDVAAFRLWQQRPLMGWGLDTFQILLPKASPQILEQPRFVHNTYLQLAAETGIVGLSLFLTILVTALIAGWRVIRNSAEESPWLLGLWLGWIAFSIHIGLDFSWYLPAAFIWWWILAGYFIGRSQPERSWAVVSTRWRVGAVIVALGLFIISGRSFMALSMSNRAAHGIANQDVTNAFTQYESALRLDPQRDDVVDYVQQLWIRRQAGDLEHASTILDKAINSNPDDYVYIFWRGRINKSRGDKELALDDFKQAYEKNRGFQPEYVLEYAKCLVDVGQLSLAKDILDTTLESYDALAGRNPIVQPWIPTLRKYRASLEV